MSEDKRTRLGHVPPPGGLRTPIGSDAPADATTLLSPTGKDGEDDEPAALQNGDVLGGKYRVVRLLGAGGMGAVYKAEHLTLGVPVAIKTMHPHIAAELSYRRRFQREAHAASLLNHANVVRVIDYGEQGDRIYLVMEYVEGVTLGHWLGGLDVPPPLAEVADIACMILDALAVAHEYGIVHRDLKPENVMLAEVGAQRVAKIADFGLAHVDDARDQGPTLTQKDIVGGTPEYMSPEQCRSLAVDSRSDLYAVGCILTTMLQLEPPFTGRSSIDILAKQMFLTPPPLNRPEGREPVPPLLERVRLELLAKKPEKRPQTAADARARIVEAMTPDAAERRLPSRKKDEPLGERGERAPSWSGAAMPLPKTAPSGRVALFPKERRSFTEADEVALSSQGLDLVRLSDFDAATMSDLAAVVIDAGDDLALAELALADARAASATVPIVVCASGLTIERINALVALGASDVLKAPAQSDAIARRVARVVRRRR